MSHYIFRAERLKTDWCCDVYKSSVECGMIPCGSLVIAGPPGNPQDSDINGTLTTAIFSDIIIIFINGRNRIDIWHKFHDRVEILTDNLFSIRISKVCLAPWWIHRCMTIFSWPWDIADSYLNIKEEINFIHVPIINKSMNTTVNIYYKCVKIKNIFFIKKKRINVWHVLVHYFHWWSKYFTSCAI